MPETPPNPSSDLSGSPSDGTTSATARTGSTVGAATGLAARWSQLSAPATEGPGRVPPVRWPAFWVAVAWGVAAAVPVAGLRLLSLASHGRAHGGWLDDGSPGYFGPCPCLLWRLSEWAPLMAVGAGLLAAGAGWAYAAAVRRLPAGPRGFRVGGE